MPEQSKRKLIVSIAGTIVGLCLVGALYFVFGRPKLTQWREDRANIKSREKRLTELRAAFGNQRDPQVELRTLAVERVMLIEKNKAIEPIKTVGVETRDLPSDLQDPDPEIRKQLYRDYIRQVMDVTETSLKNELKAANLSSPSFSLYTELEDADEAAYYLNRAAGIKGIINAMAKTSKQGYGLIFEDVRFEDYERGKKRRDRDSAVNILNYEITLTIDTTGLIAFLYNLREEKSYYFIEEMTIEPSTKRIPSPANKKGLPGKGITAVAEINTTMVFQSQVEKAKVAAAKAAGVSTVQKKGKVGGLFALAGGMKTTVQQEIKEEKEKKWWQFWK